MSSSQSGLPHIVNMEGIRRGNPKSVTRGMMIALLATTMVVMYFTSGLGAPHLYLEQAPLSCHPSGAISERDNQTNSSQSTNCSPKFDVMFMKTHKTASSTLLNILFRFGEKHRLKFAFPDGRNDFYYPSPFHHSQVKNYRPGACFNIICNHMRFDGREVSRLLPSDSAYITILRDPARLFESSFHYYGSMIPLTWWIPGPDKLAEFLSSPRTYYKPDGYNSFYLKNVLFFDFGFDNNLEADDPNVDTAVRALAERFDLVLIAEHFEESLVLLRDALCWTTDDLLFFSLNARRAASVSRLSPEQRARARDWNGADWRLYRHFNATLWAKVEAYGRARMERDVMELRRRNAEMRGICLVGGGAVEAGMIQDLDMLPWQPVGETSILGYNLRNDIDPQHRTLCRKMLTPEIQYLSSLGVNLWLTQLWGWLKDILC
ncbi:galactosylceramide sulfotransferase isoform X1 [Hypomesus transpacificus]|uniref:galactosylceramide sulfotransferase isoform X1 n=2 Tax=Hypomesus transpacificus TaxID=137520 RepID=UPI001F0866B8|nr:galactosylceramide sulfotransferase isoform X1 [Hypomesus transpacificus]